jgi:hypothetical protein
MRASSLALAAATMVAAASPCSAGIYTDAMAKCLVAKTTPADRTSLIQWVFGAMSANPAVSGMSSATEAQRTRLNRQTGELLQRLMLEDCHPETVAAMKYEGNGSVEASFGTLGEVAMGDLMADPAVRKEIEAMAGFLDRKRFEALGREVAGNTPGDSAKKN